MTPPKLLNNVKFLQKCIIVDDQGRILALRRAPGDIRRPNCWDLPGGNYKKGETVEDCIKREVREETSLVLHTMHPVHIASNMGTAYKDINVIAICYSATGWTGEVTLSSEHVESRWVTPDEFMRLDTGDDGGFLKDSVEAYLTYSKNRI